MEATEERRSWLRALARPVTLPVRDVLRGLEVGVEAGPVALVLVFVGLAVGWWVYVPCHELLHVLGCVATGGSVSRLEIDPLYGGAFLAHVFPFVTSGGDYAGRLSGFDTGGSDLVYFATDLAPFVLTLLPGVWALRRAIRRGHAYAFGFWIAWALAPFVSWTGDAYEIGSLVVANLAGASEPTRALLIGDDVFRVVGGLREAGARVTLWAGFALAWILGTLWAFGTYALADRLARRLGEPHGRAREPVFDGNA